MAVVSNIMLNDMSGEELTHLIEDARATLVEKSEAARRSLVEEITAKAAALGLSLEALVKTGAPSRTNMRKSRSDAGKTIAAKFRSPDGATWSGRGRKPTWLSEFEAQGRDKSELAVS